MADYLTDFVVTLHTSEYRGDHSADAQISFEYPATTTLQEIVNLLEQQGSSPSDFVTVRLLQAAPHD